MNEVRVCSFESRRAPEIEGLIERHGGVPFVAPSMREVPLGENQEVLAFAEALLAGDVDVVVFLTGVGARGVLEVVETRHSREEFLAALDRSTVAIRGPKPAVVLREWGTTVDIRAPEPNTWRELLASLESAIDLAGKRIAVQEYGVPNGEFYFELERRGATVRPVPVYRWAFPEETGPLEQAIRRTCDGEFDVLMFTSANQFANVLLAAEGLELRDRFLDATSRALIASIGPTCSEALREAGVEVGLEASPPKMGVLVREAIVAARLRHGGSNGS